MNDNAVRIVVVDDDPASLRSIARLLERDGFRVDARASGGEAFASDLEAASLLVTDISMPGIDGLALAKIIRGNHPRLPVIAMSGDPSYARLCRADRLRFLAKPFSIDALRATIASALEEAKLRAAETAPALRRISGTMRIPSLRGSILPTKIKSA